MYIPMYGCGWECVCMCVCEKTKKEEGKKQRKKKESKSDSEREKKIEKDCDPMKIYSMLHYSFSKLLLYHFGANLLI